ncbi:hypothetical protein FS837_006875 [Tulasnella sp. UAMH 9824]|nr:hypothetical protein FS837_006875 [Tulasnella sp. UAMH 9824]
MDIELLKELGEQDSSTSDAWQTLSTELSKADWSRFQFYAHRVRDLSYDSDHEYRGESSPPLPPNAMAMLYLHHPSGLVLLPHLERLEWSTDGSPTSIIPFLSSKVKFLEVEIVDESLAINNFFYAAATRSPNLESLTLQTNIKSRDVEDSFLRAIRTWKALQHLIIPSFYLRPSVLEAVASLPNLTSLEHAYRHKHHCDEAAMLQNLPPNAFPKLKTFDFNSDAASALQLIQTEEGFFARLFDLHLNAPYCAGDTDLQRFVQHLGKGCPQLVCVELDIWLRPGFRPEDVSPLPSGVFESLFPCRELTMLQIRHPLPVTFDDTDMERMAMAWPALDTLSLRCEPHPSLSTPDSMGNSLSILSAFAKHFPKLEILGLFFAKDKVVEFHGDLCPEHEFHHLDELYVGVSAVPGDKLHDAAFLIASLCIRAPMIDIGPNRWYTGEDDSNWPEYRRQWEEIEMLLKFAMRAKTHVRAKVPRTVDQRGFDTPSGPS